MFIKCLSLILLVLIILLSAKLYSPNQGIFYNIKKEKIKIDKLQADCDKIKLENFSLNKDIDKFKNIAEVVEEEARYKMNMIKPNESFYQVIEPVE